MCWCDFYRTRSTEVHAIVRAKVNNGGVWSWSASGLQGVVGEKGGDGGLVLVGHLHQCAVVVVCVGEQLDGGLS